MEDNNIRYRFGLIKSSKGIIKLRRTERGTGGEQKVISLGLKSGTYVDGVLAETKAQAILLQHEIGKENLFETALPRPKNKLAEPISDPTQVKNPPFRTVMEDCYSFIRRHHCQDKRNEGLGIVNRMGSSTSITYTNRIKAFDKYIVKQFGDSARISVLRDIKVFENWVDEMTDEGQSFSTIEGKIMTIWSVFQDCRIFEEYGISEERFRKFKGSKRVKKTKSIRVDESQYLNEEELEKCRIGWNKLKEIQSESAKYAPLFWFLTYSGCRIGIEGLQLQLKEIDWEEKQIYLKISTENKRSPGGYLPLCDKAINALRDHIEIFKIDNPNAFVFKDIEYKNFHACLRKYIRLWIPGKKSNPHMLRHTFATLLLSKKASVWDVANLLRHKNTQMIEETYGHFANASLRKTLELL